jgi:alpha-N-arabinofuranosidase
MGLAFELYRHHTGSTVLEVQTEVDGYDAGEVLGTPLHRVPYLDCIATVDAPRRKLFVAVINRHKTQDIRTAVRMDALSVAPAAVVRELNAPEATTVNDFDSPHNVSIKQRSLEATGTGFDYVFPAHSATIIELSLR